MELRTEQSAGDLAEAQAADAATGLEKGKPGAAGGGPDGRVFQVGGVRAGGVRVGVWCWKWGGGRAGHWVQWRWCGECDTPASEVLRGKELELAALELAP